MSVSKGVKDSTIPSTMTSVVCHAPKDYRLEEIKVPECGDDDVLVKVCLCGICAGDAKCFHGTPMFWGDKDRKAYVEAPVTPGHEFIGEVVQIGKNAQKSSGLQIGDQTISEQIVPCWKCRYCLRGNYWLCEVHDIYGFHTATQGGMAEYMKFPANSINYKVPHSLHSKEAVFIEPLSCAVHGVDRAEIRFGDTVVVSGCGAIGLGMIGAAKNKSPERIIALDLMDSRLDVARECGADIVLNPLRDDVVKTVKDMCGGYGCDVYMEATGAGASVQQGLLMLAKAGTFLEFSVFAKPATIDWTIIGDTKELNIRGGHLSGNNGYRHAISMLENNQLPMNKIITHEFAINEIEKGIDQVSSGKDSIKCVIDPNTFHGEAKL